MPGSFVRFLAAIAFNAAVAVVFRFFGASLSTCWFTFIGLNLGAALAEVGQHLHIIEGKLDAGLASFENAKQDLIRESRSGGTLTEQHMHELFQHADEEKKDDAGSGSLGGGDYRVQIRRGDHWTSVWRGVSHSQAIRICQWGQKQDREMRIVDWTVFTGSSEIVHGPVFMGGEFRLNLPTTSDFIIVINAPGYKPWFYVDPSDNSSSLHLASGEQKSLDVEMVPEPKKNDANDK
jgi:hypothetical protein